MDAQQLKQQFDQVYNMDPILYNGRIFTDYYRTGVDGTQFFIRKSFSVGDLKVRDHVYKQQNLNYEVYKQKLLLSFTDKNNAVKVIEVPLENVQYFYLRSKYFEVIAWQDNTYKIFQVFRNGQNEILIQWFKTLKSSNTTTTNRRQFSDLKKQIWLFKDDEYYLVKNNKSFIKLFLPEQKTAINKWLKKNQIKIQKADDKKLQLLIDYWSLKW